MNRYKKIFIDFGNSYIKLKKQTKIFYFNYENLTDLKNFLINQKPSIVYFIKTKFDFHHIITQQWWPKNIVTIEIKTQQVLKYLSLNKAIANKQLGIDLVLMWFYIVQNHYQNVLIICYGTWTTFLNIKNNQLCDVGISPGLLNCQQLMFNKQLKTKLISVRGTQNNLVFGYGNYLILEGLYQYCLSNQQQLIITGGYGNQISKQFNQPNCLFLKELSLLGLELFVNFIVLKTKI